MMKGAAGATSRALACAGLIRANGWRHPEFVGPLLACQFYDEARWLLPATDLLRAWVTPEMSLIDLAKVEGEIQDLRQKHEAVRDGSYERSLRAEIESIERQLREPERTA